MLWPTFTFIIQFEHRSGVRYPNNYNALQNVEIVRKNQNISKANFHQTVRRDSQNKSVWHFSVELYPGDALRFYFTGIGVATIVVHSYPFVGEPAVFRVPELHGVDWDNVAVSLSNFRHFGSYYLFNSLSIFSGLGILNKNAIKFKVIKPGRFSQVDTLTSGTPSSDMKPKEPSQEDSIKALPSVESLTIQGTSAKASPSPSSPPPPQISFLYKIKNILYKEKYSPLIIKNTSINKKNKTETPSAESHFPVWYATNRQWVLDSTGKLIGFSAKLSESVSYGKCLVNIPKGHAIGKVQSGFWQRLLLAITFRKDSQKLCLTSINPQKSSTYWAGIQREAKKWAADSRCGVVFIHGYNVSFENAAIRAAQIGYDLQVRGPMSFFSWPSQGTLLGYTSDESVIEASEQHIMQYLLDFAKKSEVERIHIIAHSMGNRGLLRALQRIVANTTADSPKLFEHFILAAPDVDQALFLSLADHYERVAHHTTLYVSDKDLALASSRMLRTGMARAGLAPPVTIAPHIDTVHVANIDMTFLGHGYVAEARDVLHDMHTLIAHNAPPDKRMGLRSAHEAGQRYWIIGA